MIPDQLEAINSAEQLAHLWAASREGGIALPPLFLALLKAFTAENIHEGSAEAATRYFSSDYCLTIQTNNQTFDLTKPSFQSKSEARAFLTGLLVNKERIELRLSVSNTLLLPGLPVAMSDELRVTLQPFTQEEITEYLGGSSEQMATLIEDLDIPADLAARHTDRIHNGMSLEELNKLNGGIMLANPLIFQKIIEGNGKPIRNRQAVYSRLLQLVTGMTETAIIIHNSEEEIIKHLEEIVGISNKNDGQLFTIPTFPNLREKIEGPILPIRVMKGEGGVSRFVTLRPYSEKDAISVSEFVQWNFEHHSHYAHLSPSDRNTYINANDEEGITAVSTKMKHKANGGVFAPLVALVAEEWFLDQGELKSRVVGWRVIQTVTPENGDAYAHGARLHIDNRQNCRIPGLGAWMLQVSSELVQAAGFPYMLVHPSGESGNTFFKGRGFLGVDQETYGLPYPVMKQDFPKKYAT